MYMSKSFLVISFGICIFLYAITVLENSFSMLTNIENFLKNMTTTRFKSFSFGLLVTTVMQSTGLISILAISFLSAGLIDLASGLSIVYGTNLGAVTGIWLIAGFGVKVDIANYAMPLIIIGVICIFNKSTRIKGAGYFLFSIGLLFLGIHYMKSGFDNIKGTMDLSKFAMQGVSGLLVYTFIGLILTVIMQSSHVVLTLAITALSANQITYENSVAIAIGSNVGSTVMAILGSFNANAEGRKLTVAHVVFNVTSALITLIFVNFFMWLSDQTAKVMDIADDDYTIKLAIFHTYFNVVGVSIFYPLTSTMVKLLNKYVKLGKKRNKVDTAYYLDEKSLQFTSSALEVLNKEIDHLYSNTSSIISKSISINQLDIKSELSTQEIINMRNTPIKINFDELYSNRFKEIYSQIIDFAITASSKAKKDDVKKFMDIRRAALILAESIKDIRNAQPNFYKFMSSNNPYIKSEYEKLRIKLLKSLRAMDKVRNVKDEDCINSSLKELEQICYDKFDLELDVLLVDKKISNTMATSLMNDSAIVQNVIKNLLEILTIIFSNDKNIKEISDNIIQTS